MNWKQQALALFAVPKPDHFGNPQHCCECAEHNETLTTFDVHSIGLEQLGNPGWDPMCFAQPEGLIYYLPAMIRITFDTIGDPTERYVDQFLFHLIKDGPGHSLVAACNKEQRQFVEDFLMYLIEHHSEVLNEDPMASEDIFKAYEIWHLPADVRE